MQIQLKTNYLRPMALLSASLIAHLEARYEIFSSSRWMLKYFYSYLGCKNFLMNRSAQLLLTAFFIFEFLTRSIPIPSIFILYIDILRFSLRQSQLNQRMKQKQQTQLVQKRNIKALLCQISPVYKNKIATIQTIGVSLQKYTKNDHLDIVLFPEMAFTGYNFANAADALPFSVKQNSGEDFEFARSIAVRLKAYIAFGYIEAVEYKANGYNLYNSAAVIDREGNMIANYRKKHLYYNDKLWAKQGDQFVSFDLTTAQNKTLTCALGICMDINPKDFIAGDKFELADHIVKTKADVVLFLTNWVDSEKDSIHSNDVAATYKYWLHRLIPVILSKKCVLVLAADRVGKEYDYFSKKNIMFYGSSAAIMLNPHKIISNLDVQNEGYMLVQTFLP